MIFSFEEFEKNALEFEEVLKQKCDKRILVNSNLEKIIINIMELYHNYENKIKLDDKIDHRPEWRKIVGLSDLLKKILRIKEHPEFEKLCPHILLLLGNTEMVQNSLSSVFDDSSNKIFELLVACSLLTMGKNLDIEDPVKSADGKNPDILIEIDNMCWGFACKVLHTEKIESYLGNLSNGIKQIQDSRAEKGCVIINYKNILKHDDFWPFNYNVNKEINYGTYKNADIPTKLLLKEVDNTYDEMMKMGVDRKYFNSLFKEKKALPIALNYLSTVVGTKHSNKEMITTIKFIKPICFGRIEQSDLLVIEKLNNSLQDY